MAEFEKMDEVFRDKLNEGAAHVPADSWQAIKQKVAGQTEGKKRNKYIFFSIPLLWVAAGFLAGVSLTGTSFYVYQLQKENDELKLLVEQYESTKLERGAEAKTTSFVERGKQRPIVVVAQEVGQERTVSARMLDTNLGDSKRSQTSFGTSEKQPNRRGQKEKEMARQKTRVLADEKTGGKKKNAFLITEMQKLPNYHPLDKNERQNFRAPLSTEQKKDSVAIPLDSLKVKPLKQKAEEKQKEKTKGKLFGLPVTLGMYLAPEVASRSVHFSDNEDPELIKYKQNDKAKFGFSGGLSLDLELPKNFYVRTGLNYWNVGDRNSTVLRNTKMDTTVIVNKISITPEPDSTQGFIGSPGVKTLDVKSLDIKESFSQFSSTVQNNYHYIGVPLLLGMKLGRSNVSAGVYSGIMANILLSPNRSVYYIYYDPENPGKYVQSERELSRFTFTYWGGIDIDVRLSKNWSFNVSPNVKYSITSLYRASDAVSQLPYAFGLQLGCKYRWGVK